MIAEAVELIEAVEARDISSIENSTRMTGFLGRHLYEKIKPSFKEPIQRLTVNGSQSPVSSNGMDFHLSIFMLQNVLNLKSLLTISGSGDTNMLPNGTQESAHCDKEERSPRPVRIKKWVRGRFVEVIEET